MKSLYQSRQFLTYLFVGFAITVGILSLVYSNKLVKELSHEERNKMEIWAAATESIAESDENADVSVLLKILQSNTTIPLILLDKTNGAISTNNIKFLSKDTVAFLQKKMHDFAAKHPPIQLSELNQELYYDDSYTLKQLQIYPYVQLLVIAIFITLAFFALNRSQRADQNKVWVGLSKETAHQLGTPISSLVAWTEYLKLKDVDPVLVAEIGKDVHRLQTIAERFSKIGSATDKKSVALQEAVERSVAYLSNRISNRVDIRYLFPETPALVELNEPLFSWVMENLTKNAVDSMSGEGVITFSILQKGKKYILDVTDTGKGIPKSNFKNIFHPGFTTKERGWGLGLSLAKRIIESYHNGEIFVAKSEIGKGTTFRIVLRKS